MAKEMHLHKSPRSSLFDQCACGNNKHKKRSMCHACRHKWRMAHDPSYRAAQNARKRSGREEYKIVPCPKCGGDMVSKSRLCKSCGDRDIKESGLSNGPVLSYSDAAMLYSYRNPDDEITQYEAKIAEQNAMRKIRRAIEDMGENEELIDAVKNLEEFL